MTTQASEIQTCTKCGFEKAPEDFPKVKSTYRLKDGIKRVREYRLRYCKDCKRKQDTAKSARRRREQPDYQRQWRERNPDKVKAQQDKYNHSPGGKAARAKYAKTEKSKAAHQRYRQSRRGQATRRRAHRKKAKLKRLALSANLPAEVVRPFLERLLLEYKTPATSLAVGEPPSKGYGELAVATGVHRDTIRHIMDGTRKGVAIEVIDKLALHADFTLEELTDRTREWAMLTGDRWPVGYHGRSGGMAS